tara:strand:+ start:115 stop:399 length:285 start_codon:yes stop_codon:yes gene_type:complete
VYVDVEISREVCTHKITTNYEKGSIMQSKRMSFYEAKTNAILGLVISYLFTLFGLPLLGVNPSPSQAAGITFCYFFLSFARSYALRRFFNRGLF